MKRSSPLDRATPVSRLQGILAGAGAALGHALFAVVALTLAARPPADRPLVEGDITQMVEVALVEDPEPEPALEEEPEPEPEPEPPPRLPEPPPAPRPEPAPLPKEVEPPPAPAAAQAGALLVQETPSEEAVDPEEAFVQGEADLHAGGITEAGGTSEEAVRDEGARAGGIEDGKGEELDGIDRSRPPELAGGARWNCPFPEEADEWGIDSAVVILRVQVSSEGKIEDIEIVKDPGYGFGWEARRCARSKRWAAALDRAGNAIGMTSRVTVRFER